MEVNLTLFNRRNNYGPENFTKLNEKHNPKTKNKNLNLTPKDEQLLL